MKRTLIAIVLLGLAVSLTLRAEAKEKEEHLRMKRFETPAVKVYVAVAQVVSEDYELASTIREGYTVVFYESQSLDEKGWVVTAICHEDGEKSAVTLYFKRNGSMRIVGIEKLKDKMAEKFWARLEKALKKQLAPPKERD
jgi:hypothetical protein